MNAGHELLTKVVEMESQVQIKKRINSVKTREKLQ